MNTPTKADLNAGLSIVFAVTETIREAGSVVSGHLYAGLMTKGVDFRAFEKVVGIITGSGLVAKRGDLLVWIGPAIAPSRSN